MRDGCKRRGKGAEKQKGHGNLVCHKTFSPALRYALAGLSVIPENFANKERPVDDCGAEDCKFTFLG
jgi:hypothetical protein